jgi:predicted dehydrogenase
MNKLKGAVIGYGFISSRGHVPAYQSRPDVEIVAVADVAEGRRRKAAEALPSARVYQSAEALLDAEGSQIDFVDICTPPRDHAMIALLALARGLHVICEKPLTCTLSEARELLRAASEARRVVFPCHNYRHAPVVQAIREIIQSGRIGRVRSVALSTYRNTHAKGVTEWQTDWRREHRVSGGGIAMDHGSHTFYLTFDWLGSYPSAVTGKMSTLDAKWDTEDNFSAVLTFPSGLAHAHLTWTAGVRKVIYAVQGERGAVTVTDDELELALMDTQIGADGLPVTRWDFERRTIASHWMDASHKTWFGSLFDDFKSAIARDDFVGRDLEEAYRCIEIITAAYRSAADGCREVPLGGLDGISRSR